MTPIQLGTIGLGAIRKVQDLWRGARSESYIDYTAPMRVEPLVLVDASASFLEATPQVLQSLTNLFAGYYTQAIALSNTVGKIEVLHHLDRLNPSRNPLDSGANSLGWMLSKESYKHKLPMPEDFSLAMETTGTPANTHPAVQKARGSETGFGRNTSDSMQSASDLSVGKMVMVEITDGQHKATFPISIRLMANIVPTANLVHILTVGSEETTSTKERWHAWKDGRLEFVRDLVFCNDLIDAHRKNLMQDKNDLYTNMLNRQRSNQLSTILSGNPSIATASNLAILTSDTVEQLELKVNGSLSNPRVREDIFKKTYLMIMAVIEPEWNRVTFYHRGIKNATTLSINSLKAANKGNGPDVAEILKAYQLGSSPSL